MFFFLVDRVCLPLPSFNTHRDMGCLLSLALLPPTGKKEEEIREPVPKAGLQASAFPSPSPQARGEISRSSLKPSGAAAWGTSFPFAGKVLNKLRYPFEIAASGLIGWGT